jgi:hypothetical protein
MKLKEMIDYLVYPWTSSGTAPHAGDPILDIIAALKAGSQMREELRRLTDPGDELSPGEKEWDRVVE